MKKQYISPELEILILRSADIITASIGAGGGSLSGDEDEFGEESITGFTEGWDN